MTEDKSLMLSTRRWYESVYARSGTLRNDLLQNPEVTFQVLANEAAFIAAIRATGIDPSKAVALDVGCGSGNSMLTLLRLGFSSKRLHGLDILPERLWHGKEVLPCVNFAMSDATAMCYDESTFDIVMESGMFATIDDDQLAGRIADEMLRVCKPGAVLLLGDWRFVRPGLGYRALNRDRVRRLFKRRPVGRWNGALVPPIGRALSARAPWAYFTVQAMAPLLVGFQVTALRA
jgi:SAM-dependent methyltransferase